MVDFTAAAIYAAIAFLLGFIAYVVLDADTPRDQQRMGVVGASVAGVCFAMYTLGSRDAKLLRADSGATLR